ncbi:MAG: nucleoside triphosphate pyrophosphohydrolase [Eubacteriaceae bacterium]|jgi:tetrapyrrole methylase family protein/MazG family protein
MGKISIVGLGPGDYGQITVETLELLKNGENYFRTAIHPCVDKLKEQGISFTSFDQVYEEQDQFKDVYSVIAETLAKRAGESDIVYAVPGNPCFGEQSVTDLITLCSERDIPYRIFPAVSFVDNTADTLEFDPVEGLTVLDAFAVVGDAVSRQTPDPSTAALITQVYNSHMASEVKLALARVYPDDTEIILLYHAGLPDESVDTLPLYELDRQKCDHLTSVFIPPVPENTRNIGRLLEIMRILRSPEGCPWDKEQDHKSLKSCLIEEAYEVADAIEQEDFENLQEELGDLLLQIVFHAQLAEEEGLFTFEDVVEGISRKMIRRHPHVFGDVSADTSEEVLANWDEIKKTEKEPQSVSGEMKAIPKSFTALMEAQKLQSKASGQGFDWDNPLPSLEKVREETDEVLEELNRKPEDPDKLRDELGDLLFAAVNTARLSGLQAEDALRQANAKFIRRYSRMEELADRESRDFSELNLEEQEDLWKQAKQEEKE